MRELSYLYLPFTKIFLSSDAPRHPITWYKEPFKLISQVPSKLRFGHQAWHREIHLFNKKITPKNAEVSIARSVSRFATWYRSHHHHWKSPNGPGWKDQFLWKKNDVFFNGLWFATEIKRKPLGGQYDMSLYIYTVYQSFPKITELERPQCSKHFDGGRALTVEAMLKPPTNGFPLTTHWI